MCFRVPSLGIVCSLFCYSCLISYSPLAQAAAKERPRPNPGCATPGSGKLTTASPVIKVQLKQIKTQPFVLPNGLPIDMSVDVQSMFNTVVTSTPVFSPTDIPDVVDSCDSHIEIRAAVTTLQLNVAEVGISFGYTPSGTVLPGIGGVNIGANAKVNIGTIAMDFSVWQCTAGSCSAVAASTATHLTSGVNASIGASFGVISAGPSFVYNTPMGEVLRKIMVNGVSKLAASSRLAELTWWATVRDSTPDIGALIFDAGVQSRLASNQAFVVYAALDPSATGVCRVYEPIATVHTVAVYPVSSVAFVDESLSSRGVQVGDVVMVRSLP